jgi:ABC-2 type transport system permease protein
MLNRIHAVIRREYLERVRTKAFWISTLVVPIFLGAVMILPAWLAARGGGEFSVAVLDLSGRFFDPVQTEVDRLLSGDEEKLIVTLVRQDPGPDSGATRERLKEQVQNKSFDGVLVIPATMPDEGQPEYIAPNDRRRPRPRGRARAHPPGRSQHPQTGQGR